MPDPHHPLSSFLHFWFESPLAFASYGGAWFAHGPMDRLKVELIVGDRQVQKAVDVITQYGQVALLRVNEALQIVPALSNT